ncbi:AMP-binding protein [Streptomyces seoulensis]
MPHGFDNAPAAPENRAVPHLIAARVRQEPDAPAVVDADKTLTYRELDERTNHLAHLLVSAGVTAESRVGMLTGRSGHSSETVVAMLAVLKAGGVYVPLHECPTLTERAHRDDDGPASPCLSRPGTV